VRVRRPDFVTINLAAYGRQHAGRAQGRARARQADPFRLGLYGPLDDDGANGDG